MARRPDQQPLSVSTQQMFSDRLSESAAMKASLEAVDVVLSQDEIATNQLTNVLTFYGIGGVGKSSLSRRLEQWCQHRLPSDVEWGAPPTLTPIRTARWDFVGHQGQADLPSMLIALRAAVTGPHQKWPAFDLALAAYLSATRPGQSIAVNPSQDQTGDVIAVLSGIAADLGAMNVVTSFSAAAVGRLITLVRSRLHESIQLRRFESLGRILDMCGQISVGDIAPDVAVEVAWLLTEEVEARSPKDRPRVAVFIDHFEKLQSDDAVKSEVILNRLLAHLPWVLFVVTGRNHLDWGGPRGGLPISGASRWPLLQLGAEEEPRQHLLGHLSPSDARRLVTARNNLAGWGLPGALIDQIVARTGGWPLHLDMVFQVATNRVRAGDRDLSDDELLADLPDLVRRLLEDFTVEEAHIFNAMCLLPYFDVSLCASIAGSSSGAVERVLSRSVVTTVQGSRYPHRVHEELRRLVRKTGSRTKGGWADEDWKAAALRGLDEIERRHAAAKAASDEAEKNGHPLGQHDALVLSTLALSLTLAFKEGVYAPWLGEAVRSGPSMRGLSPLLPTVGDEDLGSDAGALIRQIHVLNGPTAESIEPLRKVYAADRADARSAGLWLAYRLRANARYEESIEQLQQLIDRYGDQFDDLKIYHRQIATSLSNMRRFREALDYYATTRGTGPDSGWDSVYAASERQHGILGQRSSIFDERLAKVKSARFRLELTTDALRRRTFEGEDVLHAAKDLLERATDIGEPAYQKSCLLAIGLTQLTRPDDLAPTLERIALLNAKTKRTFALCELLALRAYYTRSGEHLAALVTEMEAIDPARGPAFILTEVLLEELGHPMPSSRVAQWLIPYEQVRKNWLAIADSVLERTQRLS